MLIKFLSFSHSVCQGKGQPSILCCLVGWLPCRHGINGRLLAGHPVLHPPYKFILEKLPRHQTSSKLLLVENILRDLFHLLLEIMKSFRIFKVQHHTSVISDLRIAGISCWLFSSSFLPFYTALEISDPPGFSKSWNLWVFFMSVFLSFNFWQWHLPGSSFLVVGFFSNLGMRAYETLTWIS